MTTMDYRPFRLGPVHGSAGREAVWLRLWSDGPGLALRRTPLLFSERHGHTRFLRLPFGWRLTFLRRY